MSLPDDFEQRVENALREAGENGLTVDELRHTLQTDVDRNVLRQALKRLSRAGSAVRLERDHYAAPSAQADVVGRLKYRAGRYTVEGADVVYTVSPENLNDYVAGDVVRVTATGEENRGIHKATIVNVARPAPREVFGLIKKSGRYHIASSPLISEPILVIDERARVGGADLRIIGRAARRRRAVAGLPLCPLIAEVVVKSRQEPRTEREERHDALPQKIKSYEAYRYVMRGETSATTLLDQLARGLGVDRQFPAEALALAERSDAPDGLRDGDVDLRDEPLATIDGETAKDFDDAVSATRLENGDIELLVAIADVSYYVGVDSSLDLEARQRGSSVYLPGRVYPMLPQRLSNGLCSLVPDEDRYCAWVRMRITSTGDVSWYDLGFGLMRSAARLTYTAVQAHFDGEAPIEKPAVAASIDALKDVYHRLKHRRIERGMLDFSLPEAQIELTEDGEDVGKIVIHPRWDSHRLIEECMLVTNETVADYLTSGGWPCIYRSHDEPNEDKLGNAWKFAERMMDDVPKREGKKTIDDIMALVTALQGHPAERVANFVILRSMKRAAYATSTSGHFGIGAKRYSHFTSPIRRYADLEIHRVLREALSKERPAPGQVRRLKTRLQESATAANAGEFLADNAERYADRLMKALYMRDRVGDVFEGLVVGLQNFGMFVSTSEHNIEGLVHITTLPGRDHYALNEAQDELRGQRSGRRYRLGQEMPVQCVAVVVHEGQINFELVYEDAPRLARDERAVDVDPEVEMELRPDDMPSLSEDELWGSADDDASDDAEDNPYGAVSFDDDDTTADDDIADEAIAPSAETAQIDDAASSDAIADDAIAAPDAEAGETDVAQAGNTDDSGADAESVVAGEEDDDEDNPYGAVSYDDDVVDTSDADDLKDET